MCFLNILITVGRKTQQNIWGMREQEGQGFKNINFRKGKNLLTQLE